MTRRNCPAELARRAQFLYVKSTLCLLCGSWALSAQQIGKEQFIVLGRAARIAGQSGRDRGETNVPLT